VLTTPSRPPEGVPEGDVCLMASSAAAECALRNGFPRDRHGTGTTREWKGATSSRVCDWPSSVRLACDWRDSPRGHMPDRTKYRTNGRTSQNRTGLVLQNSTEQNPRTEPQNRTPEQNYPKTELHPEPPNRTNITGSAEPVMVLAEPLGQNYKSYVLPKKVMFWVMLGHWCGPDSSLCRAIKENSNSGKPKLEKREAETGKP
jgi:hypothetical protein